MVNDLLHRVELCDVSGPARELIKDLLREVLAEQGRQQQSAPVGALGAPAAAAYIGASRSGFYQLEKDHRLAAIAVSMGDYCVWPTADLDRWLLERRTRLEQPMAQEVA